MSTNNIVAFDLSSLPAKFRLNWHIYQTLRADAQVKFARGCADAAAGNINAPGWCEEFDRASVAWTQANPIDPVWESTWPKDAETFLGNEATDEARLLVAAAK